MLTGDDARFVPLLVRLEKPLAESGLSAADAAALVSYSLGNGSVWWADHALDWVEQGVPSADVKDALNRAVDDDRLPQPTRHRALRLAQRSN
ncbi:MAG: hypothetical protein AB7O74_10665 [Candidatus Nanopelagicales bacterium]